MSFALGAFFAGMVMRESELSHRAVDESLPLRDAFAVLFFRSVGMLFDPATLVNEPLHVFVVVLIIVLGKSIAAFFIVLACPLPAQHGADGVGEPRADRRVLVHPAGMGCRSNCFHRRAAPDPGRSIDFDGGQPAAVRGCRAAAEMDPRGARHSPAGSTCQTTSAAALPMTVDQALLHQHVVLVGYGRVGARIGESLREHRIPFVVAEQNRELFEQLRAPDGIWRCRVTPPSPSC